MRAYVYFSDGFSFNGSKLAAINNTNGPGSGQFDMGSGAIHFYGFDDHTYGGGLSFGDCCSVGPPVNVSGYQNTTPLILWGKWWRMEFVVANRAGPGIRYELYGKNITDGTPEQRIIDTGVACPDCRPDPRGLGATDARPPQRLDDFLMNFHREGRPNILGWNAIAYWMLAGWDTNAGQRIGRAYEVER